MSSQPGWHPDPVPAQPGQPPQLRYWDGTRWTEHVAPAQQPAGQAGPPAAYQGQYGNPYAGHAAYAGGKATTTPDGERLAGWWQRVLAYVIDSFVVSLVSLLIALPWVREIYDVYMDFLDEAFDSSSTATLDTGQLQSDIFGPLVIVVAIQLAVGFVYQVGFLMWRQATPGKMVVGLRVRLREQPGPMPIGTVLVRWVTQFGPGILGVVPFLGSLTGIYSLLDHLWPLWDQNKQAIHDKAAKTNVVRTR